MNPQKKEITSGLPKQGMHGRRNWRKVAERYKFSALKKDAEGVMSNMMIAVNVAVHYSAEELCSESKS